jgi:putative FmdB family regulatory protein
MPRYDYQCQSCGAYHEVVCAMAARADEIECPRCHGVAEQVILTAPGVMTAGMTNMTQDVAIGKDSDRRWGRIFEKKAERDRIRRESGKSALTATGAGEYAPNDKRLQFVGTAGTERDD